MKKFSSLFVMALALVCIAVTSVSADVAYTVVDNSYQSGALGLVQKDGENLSLKKDLNTSLNGDQCVYSFVDASNKAKIMVAQYTNGQPDTVWIFDPAAKDFSKPLKEVKWPHFSNKRGVATIGRFLYACDYDNGNIVKVDMTDDKYQEVSFLTYENAEYKEDFDMHCEKIAAVGENLYAIFSFVKDPWGAGTYKNGLIVKFDRDLKALASAEICKNATDMKVYDGKIYIVGIGGKQSAAFNAESKVQVVDPETMKVTDLLVASEMSAEIKDWSMDFRGISFSPAGDAFILASIDDGSGFSYNASVYKKSVKALTTDKKLVADDFFADSSNMMWTWGIDFDPILNKVIVIEGCQFTAYDPSYNYKEDKPAKTSYDSMALNGNLYSVTTVAVPTPAPAPAEGGSGGGCNAGFAGMLLLGLVPAFIFRKKD